MKFLTVAASEWVFGFNDPSIIAWVIVFFYLLGTFFCCRAQLAPLVKASSGVRVLWITLAVFLLLFGFNKQLDLHDLVLGFLRNMSSSERQSIAWNGFVAVMAIVMGGAAIWLSSKLLFQASRELRLAYCALLILLVFQALRFAPGPAGAVLAGHPLTEEEGLFHIHYIELIELPVLIVINVLAYRQSLSSGTNKNSVADGQQQIAA